jgi:hypothetical protein
MSEAEQQFERQAEEQQAQQLRDMAFNQVAQTGGMDQGQVTKSRTFVREYSDPDISARPGASDLEEIVAPELSQHHLYGNITEEEFLRQQPLNSALAMQVKAEFPSQTGTSSKCTGEYRRELTGQDKPVLNNEMARKIDSTLGEEGVRKQMQSQSVNASAWKGITQMKSVIKTATQSASKSAGGALGRAKNFLFGGSD